MGEFSIWHWMVVLLVVVLLFGGGKVSGLMGDLANGIKAFKKNMADDEPAKRATLQPPAESIAEPAGEVAPAVREPAAAPQYTTAAR